MFGKIWRYYIGDFLGCLNWEFRCGGVRRGKKRSVSVVGMKEWWVGEVVVKCDGVGFG